MAGWLAGLHEENEGVVGQEPHGKDFTIQEFVEGNYLCENDTKKKKRKKEKGIWTEIDR